MRHPLLCDLKSCGQTTTLPLLAALIRRVSDRESLLECVRYAQMDENAWDPDAWGRFPRALWEDKALCLELLPMLPPLYGCLPRRLQSDPDVVAALLAAEPKHYLGWHYLLCFVPDEIQLQFPDLVLRILKETQECCQVAEGVAPALWRHREVAQAMFRCCTLDPPSDSLAQPATDEEMWLQVAGEVDLEAFESFCPPNLRVDRTFLLRLVRAYPGRCLLFFNEGRPGGL